MQSKNLSDEPPQAEETGKHEVQYIVHPTPPDAQGRRKRCAHVVTRKTYSLEEFAEYVAARSQLLDASTVLFVQHAMQDAFKAILRSGDSVAFKNLFTLQLSISGSFEEGEEPDPAKGNVLKPRVRIAPAFIKEINEGVRFVKKGEAQS